jgi:hypothetical protein
MFVNSIKSNYIIKHQKYEVIEMSVKVITPKSTDVNEYISSVFENFVYCDWDYIIIGDNEEEVQDLAFNLCFNLCLSNYEIKYIQVGGKFVYESMYVTVLYKII